jgi:hypothetical protein
MTLEALHPRLDSYRSVAQRTTRRSLLPPSRSIDGFYNFICFSHSFAGKKKVRKRDRCDINESRFAGADGSNRRRERGGERREKEM